MAISESTRDEMRQLAARYPQARSALLPMLHLVQSLEGEVTPDGTVRFHRPSPTRTAATAFDGPVPLVTCYPGIAATALTAALATRMVHKEALLLTGGFCLAWLTLFWLSILLHEFGHVFGRDMRIDRHKAFRRR